MSFFTFVGVLLLIDTVLNFAIYKTTKVRGVDLIFFAAWAGGMNYGVLLGLVASIIIMAERVILNPQMGMIVFSIPIQFAAALLGSLLGPGGFLLTLVIYQAANLTLALLSQVFGGRFILFLVANTIFNIVVYNALPFIVTGL